MTSSNGTSALLDNDLFAHGPKPRDDPLECRGVDVVVRVQSDDRAVEIGCDGGDRRAVDVLDVVAIADLNAPAVSVFDYLWRDPAEG